MIRKFLARQLGHPSGIFGRLIVSLLNRGNADMNDLTLEQLDLDLEDKVLEIGFGGGYLLERIAQTGIPSYIAGIDPALDVLRLGKQKFQPQIKQKGIELKQAQGESLPYENNTFTKICTVNTVYFWSDPQRVLRECDRVLQSKGKLIICYNSPEFLAATKLTNYNFTAYQPEELTSLMTNAGFININTIKADGGHGNGIYYCTFGFSM